MSRLACAVITITSVAGLSRLIVSSTSSPETPGIITSASTRSHGSAWKIAMPRPPSSAAATLWPASVRAATRSLRTDGSSSTTRIRPGAVPGRVSLAGSTGAGAAAPGAGASFRQE
ncbi:MAG: hypothetical protein AUH92_02865 [Acidobacteria bacterium 13_1_40CM_4_69_4]|nr:MAG: hypothetical protein AUH92_02865 [Acidobacteria bacterium 13_1_40CM_4_69_4]